MKKYLLLSAIILFSSSSNALVPSNALADSNTLTNEERPLALERLERSIGKPAEKIADEIPTLLEKTLNQYPELKGEFEFDIESMQINISIPALIC